MKKTLTILLLQFCLQSVTAQAQQNLYWSSSLHTNDRYEDAEEGAYSLNFTGPNNLSHGYTYYRYFGFSVRPVCQ